MSMLKEFREFAVKGNVVDLAVGIMIGAAFGKVVDSLVKDVFMPPIGLLLGKVDFSNLFLTLQNGLQPGPYATLADATKAGAVTLNIGVFLNAIVSFVMVAFATFAVIRVMNKLKRETDAATPKEEILLLRDIRDALKR